MRACVCVCMCVYVYALRIISMEKKLCFTNTFIITIHMAHLPQGKLCELEIPKSKSYNTLVSTHVYTCTEGERQQKRRQAYLKQGGLH